MASSLSSLADNLAERIHKTKHKYGHDNKNCETCDIKYKDWRYWAEYPNVEDYHHKKIYDSLIHANLVSITPINLF